MKLSQIDAQSDLDCTCPINPTQEFMRAIAAGKAPAVARLLSEYWDRVFALTYRWLRDREEARDMTQEVFLRVWRKADLYDRRYSLSAWILRIASNLCVDYFRRKNARVHMNAVEWKEDHYHYRATPLSPEQIALRNEVLCKAVEILNALPRRQRRVLRLRLLHQCRLQEIARFEGISVGTVKSTLHNATVRLRAQLRETLSSRQDHLPKLPSKKQQTGPWPHNPSGRTSQIGEAS